MSNALVFLGSAAQPSSKFKRHALDFLAVMSPGAASIAEPKAGDPSLAKTIVPGAIAGVVGIALFPKHPVLAFLGLDAVGLNAARLLRGQGEDRKTAACNLALAASGIIGALWLEKRVHPFFGWWIGHLVGAAALTLVPGSNSHKFMQGFKR